MANASDFKRGERFGLRVTPHNGCLGPVMNRKSCPHAACQPRVDTYEVVKIFAKRNRLGVRLVLGGELSSGCTLLLDQIAPERLVR